MATFETELGSYDAIVTRGTPRYRLNKKMIPADAVPPTIKAQLDYAVEQDEVARKARNEAALAEPREEFEEIEPTVAPIASEPAAPLAEGANFTEDELADIALEEAIRNGTAVGHIAGKPSSAKELADLLYSNYGIWTVFTEKAPNLGDTHPVTGVPMVRYDVGLGYQAVRHGEVKQIFNPAPVENTPVPQSAFIGGVNPKGYETFEQRTAPSFQKQSSTIMKTYNNDPISEEPTAEPMLRGQTIRPEW